MKVKKILAGMLTGALVASFVPAQAIISSAVAGDTAVTFHTDGTGTSAFDKVLDNTASGALEVWIGGGKATLDYGAVLDGKVKLVNAYISVEDANNNKLFYNITASKKYVWAVAKDSITVKKNQQVSVAAGKVTAGTVAGDTVVYLNEIIDAKAKTYKAVGSFNVHVSKASTQLDFNGKSDGALKAVSPTLNLGQVYDVTAYAKDFATISSDGNFSIKNDPKTGNLLTFSKDGGTTWSSDGFSFRAGDNQSTTGDLYANAKLGFYTFKVAPIAQTIKTGANKTTSANIIFSSNESGKSKSLKVTIDNGLVPDTTKFDALLANTIQVTKYTSDGKATPKFDISEVVVNANLTGVTGDKTSIKIADVATLGKSSATALGTSAVKQGSDQYLFMWDASKSASTAALTAKLSTYIVTNDAALTTYDAVFAKLVDSTKLKSNTTKLIKSAKFDKNNALEIAFGTKIEWDKLSKASSKFVYVVVAQGKPTKPADLVGTAVIIPIEFTQTGG